MRRGLLQRMLFPWRELLGVLLVFAAVSLVPASPVAAQTTETGESASYDAEAFAAWREAFRAKALARGITQNTWDNAMTSVEPVARILELDQGQPEFTRTFAGYLKNAISNKRVAQGREQLAKHAALLRRVADKYQIQPRFLVAFWGLETNYGGYTGGFSVIAALATLAFDPRRGDFFEAQLIDALLIIQNGHIGAEEMTGSWAGAMGQLQFMPTTFTGFAVDGDGDGKRDIWNNLDDVFASAAHYLKSEGWHGDETWGREILLPEGFDLDLVGLAGRKQIGEWQTLGVRRANGANLPVADIEGAILLPAGHRGPAFLVYGNFRTTMIWNRSTFYALAIGILADRIAGRPALLHPPNENEPRLHRNEVVAMQQRLIAAELDPGGADGVVGRNTRKAIRIFQRRAGLPADGYPDQTTLATLKALYP